MAGCNHLDGSTCREGAAKRGPSLTRHVDGAEIEANENVIAVVVRKEMKVNGMPRSLFAYMQGWAKKWSPGCENV